MRAGLIAAVFSFDGDRLTRSVAHSILLAEEFVEKAGVKLEFVNGGEYGSTPESKMLGQMKSVFAEFEKSKIREPTMRGRREKAQQGFVNGGRPPYGYRYKGKSEGSRGELVVIPEQAEIVKRIFTMWERGKSPGQIARVLTAEGTPPRRQRWSDG